MSVRNAIKRLLKRLLIIYCITWGCLENSHEDQYIQPEKLLDSLNESDQENISCIIDKSKLVLIDYISNSDDYNKILALEILNIYKRSLFPSIIFEINSNCKISILDLLKNKMLPNSYEYLKHELISVDYFIECHGFESLFQDYDCRLFFIFYRSLAYGLISRILNLSSKEESEEILVILTPLTEIIIDSSKPICKDIKVIFSTVDIFFSSYHFGNDKDLYFDLILGFSLLTMICIELDINSITSQLEHFFDVEKKPNVFNHILYTFLARYESQYIDKVQDELDDCQFTPEQQALIWQWVRREIDFVEKTQDSENTDFQKN